MEVDTSLHPKHTLTAQLTSVQKSIRILFVSNNNRQKSAGDLGQKQRRNSSDFSVIILFESNNNRQKSSGDLGQKTKEKFLRLQCYKFV